MGENGENRNTNIIIARGAEAKREQVEESLQKTRDRRESDIKRYVFPPCVEIEKNEKLIGEIERNIELAKSVLIDIGYAEKEADLRLPTIDQVHFYRMIGAYESTVKGEVANEGGRLNMIHGVYFDISGKVVKDVFRHELGHYPAKRVYGASKEEGNDGDRLIAFGFDKKMFRVDILGTKYFQTDADDTYMRGVLREPMADIFGYFCSEKSGDNVHFVDKYYRETAFVSGLLQHLSEIRGTSFFDEFAKMYKSFNDIDYHYFVDLRNDLAAFWGGDMPRATEFVSEMNNIVTNMGLDSVVEGIDGDPNGVYLSNTREGGQLSKLARMGGFYDKYEGNIKSMNSRDGLLLWGEKTVMKKEQR